MLLLLRDYSCAIVFSINKEAEGRTKNGYSLNTAPLKQTVPFSSDGMVGTGGNSRESLWTNGRGVALLNGTERRKGQEDWEEKRAKVGEKEGQEWKGRAQEYVLTLSR